jgi:hypothetical protein
VAGDRPPKKDWSDATPAELKILAAIDDLAFELRHAPTHRQILERVGWTSRGSLSNYMRRLEQKGLITGRGRALRIVEHEEVADAGHDLPSP